MRQRRGEQKRGEVEAARLELANLKLERSQAVLRAPSDGIVTAGDIKDERVIGEVLENRIKMLVHDLHAYGTLLRQQREIDLAGASPTFLGPVRRAKEVVLAKTA